MSCGGSKHVVRICSFHMNNQQRTISRTYTNHAQSSCFPFFHQDPDVGFHVDHIIVEFDQVVQLR